MQPSPLDWPMVATSYWRIAPSATDAAHLANPVADPEKPVRDTHANWSLTTIPSGTAPGRLAAQRFSQEHRPQATPQPAQRLAPHASANTRATLRFPATTGQRLSHSSKKPGILKNRQTHETKLALLYQKHAPKSLRYHKPVTGCSARLATGVNIQRWIPHDRHFSPSTPFRTIIDYCAFMRGTGRCWRLYCWACFHWT